MTALSKKPVGFSATAGEDNLLRASTNEGGDLFAGGFDGGASALAGCVDGCRVAEVGGEIREHGV
jgi:hypothetical protein